MPLAWEAFLKEKCECCNSRVQKLRYNMMKSKYWCRTCWKQYNTRIHSWRSNSFDEKEFEFMLKREKDCLTLDAAIEEACNTRDLQWFKKLMVLKKNYPTI